MQRNQSDILGPLLCLKDEIDKGLKIGWNFHGLATQKKYQIYHVFLFFEIEAKECESFLNIYYQKLRLGQIMGIFRMRTSSNIRQNIKGEIKWLQKTTFKMDQGFFTNKYVNSLINGDIFQVLLPYLEKKNGLIVVNIICSQNLQRMANYLYNFQQKIKNIRNSRVEADRIIFNISSQLSPRDLSINLAQGSYIFSYNKQNHVQIIKRIFQSLKTLVVKKIRLRIYLGQQNICKLLENNHWRLSQAPYLQKILYAVHSCSFEQHLRFFVKENDNRRNLTLKAILDISFYDGRQVTDTKQIEIRSISKKYYQKSFQHIASQQTQQDSLNQQFDVRENSIKQIVDETLILLFEIKSE